MLDRAPVSVAASTNPYPNSNPLTECNATVTTPHQMSPVFSVQVGVMAAARFTVTA